MKKKIIRLSKSCISNYEKVAVQDVLDREYLGMGEDVQNFENALSVFFNSPVVCVNSGTAALHLALQACGVGFGDEVLVPSITYVASFQAISATGAKPIACDINPETLLLDIKDAEKRITTKSKAIMPVHYSGSAGDIKSIYKFANKNKLRVIEDAAHAFGSSINDKLVGSFGDVICFSFDGIKNITSGEGGCIVTKDETVLKKIRDARLLGVKKDTEKRYLGERSWDFDVTEQGWRYHMSNIMAAIGQEQLKRFPKFAARRQNIAKMYDRLLLNNSSIYTFSRDYNEIVPHIYVIRINGMINRKIIQHDMLEEGVQVGYHYQPNHWLSFYKDEKALPLPISDIIFPELMSLPLHFDILDSDIEFVVKTLCKIVKKHNA